VSQTGPALLEDAAQPRRLDPRTIIVAFLRETPSAILGIPLLLAWLRDDQRLFGFMLIMAPVVLSVTLGLSWLRWRAVTYEVLPDQVVLRRGVVRRTRRSIPLERIQDVSIKQGPLSRLLRLAQVTIETGGSEADEARLDSVSLNEAQRLREVLRNLQPRPSRPQTAGMQEAKLQTETIAFRMDWRRVLISASFKVSFVWVAALLGLAQTLQPLLGLDWVRWLELATAAGQEARDRVDGTLLLGAAAAVLLAGWLAGFVQAVVRNFGFTLTDAGGRFLCRRGLLTRDEVVVAKRQIQLGLVERAAFSGLLGWRSLKVQTLGGGDHRSGRQDLAPLARRSEVQALAALAGLPPSEPRLSHRVSRWHAALGLPGLVVLPALSLGVLAAIFPPASMLLMVLPFLIGIALLRGRRHRYELAPTSLQVARGVVVERSFIVPHANIQTLVLRRGPLQRRLGVATVLIDTAGGRSIHSPHVYDVPLEEAQAISARLIEHIRACRPAQEAGTPEATPKAKGPGGVPPGP
jgi:putative membrane protein